MVGVQMKTDNWYYLRSLTGRPFHVKHCDYCGADTDANPDPAMSYKILCGRCASEQYSRIEYSPLDNYNEREIEQQRREDNQDDDV